MVTYSFKRRFMKVKYSVGGQMATSDDLSLLLDSTVENTNHISI